MNPLKHILVGATCNSPGDNVILSALYQAVERAVLVIPPSRRVIQ